LGSSGNSGRVRNYIAARAQVSDLSKTSGEPGTEGGAAQGRARPFGPGTGWRLALQLGAVRHRCPGVGPGGGLEASGGARRELGMSRQPSFPACGPGLRCTGRVHLVTRWWIDVCYMTRRETGVHTSANAGKQGASTEVLTWQAREGLETLGWLFSVVSHRHLETFQHSPELPQPVGEQVVAQVVSSTYRTVAPICDSEEFLPVKA